MSLVVKKEDINMLRAYRADKNLALDWPVIFSLPSWTEAWWKVFGHDKYEQDLYSVWDGECLIGLAPLMHRNGTAYLIGSADVFDYLDFITCPGREPDFFSALLPALAEEGLKRLELFAQRPEAAVFRGFFSPLSKLLCRGYFMRENESSEIALPEDWETYLLLLNKKQRHEVRRKLRKLENESNNYIFRVIKEEGEIRKHTALFFDLFLENPDKADFLTEDMQQYFRELIQSTAAENLMRFGFLEIDEKPAAVVLFFKYEGRIYLYNSGYENQFAPLSAGLLSKILLIKNGIEEGCQIFDFLKGPEVYKTRLGGRTIPIYRAVIDLVNL